MTDKQQIALDALLAGASVQDAARHCGAARETVSRWLNHRAEFRVALEQGRQRRQAEADQRMKQLRARAIRRLKSLVGSSDEYVALRASQEVLRLSSESRRTEELEGALGNLDAFKRLDDIQEVDELNDEELTEHLLKLQRRRARRRDRLFWSKLGGPL